MTKISDLPVLSSYYNFPESQFIVNDYDNGDYITRQMSGDSLVSAVSKSIGQYYEYISPDSLFLYKIDSESSLVRGVTFDYLKSYMTIGSTPATGDLMQYYPIVCEGWNPEISIPTLSAYYQSIGDILTNLSTVGDYYSGTGCHYLVVGDGGQLGYTDYDAFKFDLYAALFYNSGATNLPYYFDANDLDGDFGILVTSTLQDDNHQHYGVTTLNELYDYFQSRSSSPE